MSTWNNFIARFPIEDQPAVSALAEALQSTLGVQDVRALARLQPHELARLLAMMIADNPFTTEDDEERLQLAERMIGAARDVTAERPSRPSPGRTPPGRKEDAPPPVPRQPVPGKPGPGKRVPEGVVGGYVRRDGNPVAGALVRAVDRRLRNERPLGEATTNADGIYEIRYAAAAGSGAKSITLVVRVIAGSGNKERILAESAARFRARLSEGVNFTLDGPRRSEFDQLVARLQPALDGAALGDLGPAEIEFLSRETSTDRDAVRRLADAHRTAASTPGVSPAAHYALAHPVGAAAGASVAIRLRAATAAGVVDSEVLAETDAAAAWLKQRDIEERFTRLRGKAPDGGAPALADILGAAGLSSRAIDAYARVVAEDPESTPDQIHERLKGADLSSSERAALRRAAKVTALARADSRVVGRLMAEAFAGRRGDVDDDDARLAPFAARTARDWEAWIGSGDPSAAATAKALEREFERAYPREALVARVNAAAGRGARPAVIEALSAHLEEHTGASVGAWKPTREQPATAGEAALAGAKRLSGMASLTDAIAALEKGHTSARTIASMPASSFVRQMTAGRDPALTESDARALHRRATRQASAALLIGAALSPEYHRASPAGTGNPWSGAASAPASADLNLLFGPADACAVPSCQSVLGQPAYLVDLLDLLKHGGVGGSAREVLLHRRPDLGHLELSCANAETRLPYIDLVNELLEHEVVRGPASGPMSWQSTWVEEDLAAHPEHLDAGAYTELEKAAYPWNLPFSLAHAEADVYLRDMGISRGELIGRVRRSAAEATREQRVAMAAATLGLSPAEVAVITAGVRQERARVLKPGGFTMVAGAPQFPARVDGVDLRAGDLVLVQGIGARELSLWRVGRPAWTRLRVLAPGELVLIEEGQQAAGTAWLAIAPVAGVLSPLLSEALTPGRRDFSRPAGAPWEYWGYDAQPASWPDLRHESVRALLDRSGLEYADLLDLLVTDYVNPEAGGSRPVAIAFEHGADQCDLTRAHVTGLDAAVLGRLHRFARLRTRTAWTVRELDRAIAVLRAPDLTDEFLVQLAEVSRLSDRLKLSIADLLTFWGDLDTEASYDRHSSPPKVTPSQYARTFQDRRRLSADQRQALAVPFDQATPAASVIGAARAVLGLSAADTQLVTGQPPGLGPLQAISNLYRWSKLAAAAHVSIPQIAAFTRVCGVSPFASPASLTAWLDGLADVRALEIGIEDVSFLLRHEMTPEREAKFGADGLKLLARVRAAAFPAGGRTLDQVARAIQTVFDRRAPQEPAHVDRARRLAQVIDGTGVWTGSGNPADADGGIMLRDGRQATVGEVRELVHAIADASRGATVDELTRRLVAAGTAASLPGEARTAVIVNEVAVLAALVEPFMVNELAQAYGVRKGVAAAVLQRTRLSPTVNAPVLYALAGSLRTNTGLESVTSLAGAPAIWAPFARLVKSVWLAGRLRWTVEDLSIAPGVRQHPLALLPPEKLAWQADAAAVVDPVVFAGLRQLASLVRLRRRLAADGLSFWTLRAAAAAIDPLQPDRIAATWSAAATAAQWPPADVSTLVGPTLLDIRTAADDAPASEWMRFVTALDTAAQLAASAGQLAAWAGDTLSLDVSADIRAAAAGKRGPAWPRVAPGLRNTLRVRQRDALLARARVKLRRRDVDSVHDWLLVDVEMGPEQLTTRIALAVAAVQRFIQRALLGAIADQAGHPVVLDEHFESPWAWMRSYRTWRDHRMLFLYPENHLMPEVRDDKSPLFLEFEQALSQRQLTGEAIDDAFGSYLQKLDDIARMEMMGSCIEELDDNRLLHIVARTRGVPHEYYHCTWSFYDQTFSAWQRLDVDIDGDWVIPVVREERLSLYWIKHARQLEGMTDALGLIPAKPFPLSIHYPMYQDQYTLSWSTRMRKGWTPKRSADRLIARPFLPFARAQFAVRFDKNRLRIGGVTLLPEFPPPPDFDPTQILLKGRMPWDQAADDAADAGRDAWEQGKETFSRAFTDADRAAGTIVAGFGDAADTVADTIKRLTEIRDLIDKVAGTIVGSGENWSIKAATDDLWSKLNAISSGLGQIIAAVQTYSAAVGNPFELPERAVGALLKTMGNAVRMVGDAWIHVNEELRDSISGFFNENLAAVFSAVSELGRGSPGWGGPTFAFEFGYFDVGSGGARALRLSPPPGMPGPPLLPPGMQAAFDILNGAIAAVNEALRLIYSLFPGYPGLYDIPVIDGAFATELALGGQGTSNLMIHGWPGSGYFLAGLPLPASTAKLSLNLRAILAEDLPRADKDSTAALFGPGSLARRLQAFDDATDDLSSIGERSSLVNIGMRVVRPLPFGPFPGRQLRPTPTIVSEDRHGRTFLMIPSIVDINALKGKTGKQNDDWHHTVVTWDTVALYHPFTTALNLAHERGGVQGIYDRALRPVDGLASISIDGFSQSFDVRRTAVRVDDAAMERLDVDARGAYSLYNWELFFHIPMLLGARLVSDYRFEDAIKWYRKVFDPTVSAGSVPGRYWRFKAFRDEYDPAGAQPIETIKEWLSDFADGSADARKVQALEAWRRDPFNPHEIARARPGAYQRATVMRTVEAFIAWADMRFRADTWESINEATQLYLLARDILGPRPALIAARAAQARTYTALGPLDAFGNALDTIEASFGNLAGAADDGADPADSLVLLSGASMLYFGIPPNDRLLGYWDTIDQRLSNIRHGLDFQGRPRRQSLSGDGDAEGALARGAGADGDAALDTLPSLPVPPFRFTFMLQKAHEYAGDVRAFGGAALAAIEKRDGEALARLRSEHELALLQAVRRVRALQIEEAEKSLEGLRQSQEGARLRKQYYSTREFLSATEAVKEALFVVSSGLQVASGVQELGAAVMHALPDISVGAGGHGNSPNASVSYGASQLANTLSATARAFSLMSSVAQIGSTMAGTIATYERRQQDWDHQAELAQNDIDQFDRQIQAADRRVAIARRELQNQELQIEQSQALAAFMHEKFTSLDLYEWMVRQVSELHLQSYLLAIDIARRAEACYRFERADTGATFVRVEPLDSLSGALQVGERLQQDLRRMEAAYLDGGAREHELTKHASLAQIDPVALLMLQQTGQCYLHLPESVFDADHPGHYLRRLKSVSLTIPCVVGPYTSINCRLTLVSSRLRLGPDAPELPKTYASSLVPALSAPVTAMAASAAQNESGLFELNLRDERYLPFEGAGAIGVWRIELPQATNRFDPRTLTDVVLHLRYTARDGSAQLREMAWQETFGTRAPAAAELSEAPPARRLFSARHDFPDAWYRFLHPPAAQADASLDLPLAAERFPFTPGRTGVTITAIKVVVIPAGTWSADGLQATLTPSPDAPGAVAADPNPGRFAADEEAADLPACTYQPGSRRVPERYRLRVLRPAGTSDLVQAGSASDPVRVRPDRWHDVIVICTYQVD